MILDYLAQFDESLARKSEKAYQMLANQHDIYYQVTNDTIFGVIKSQSNPDLLYGCYIRSNGEYSCMTQKGNACGGLRGTPCKHILTLVAHAISQLNYRNREIVYDWITEALRQRPHNIKSHTRFIFEEYRENTTMAINYFHLPEKTSSATFPILEEGLRLNIQYPLGRRATTLQIIDEEPIVNLTNQTLVEVHATIDLNSETTLETTRIICVGHKGREMREKAIQGGWVQCEVCMQWFCPDCLEAFQECDKNCPSHLLGLASPHELKFSSKTEIITEKSPITDLETVEEDFFSLIEGIEVEQIPEKNLYLTMRDKIATAQRNDYIKVQRIYGTNKDKIPQKLINMVNDTSDLIYVKQYTCLPKSWNPDSYSYQFFDLDQQ